MRNSFFFFVLVLTIFSINACSKDPGQLITPNGPFRNPDPYPPPTAGAGSDVFVFMPADSCKLDGWTAFPNNGIKSFKWRKISGPASDKINNPDSLSTSVTNLIEGFYEFELTVTDKLGLSDIDTVSVSVGKLSTREVYFNNINWGPEDRSLAWGSYLTVKNIYSQIPRGSVFKVYMMKIIYDGWLEVPVNRSSGSEKARYTFNLIGSNLYVLSNDEERSSANIMIVY